ncbi:hypothetical protein PBCVNEJV1_688R [Paramecium bursaria Chlorella virus NE-JV-1]|nr:hypothetical protein PBCVNEJV1_688R [Paramecium bursaria Chlorella virus NE-JV-1]
MELTHMTMGHSMKHYQNANVASLAAQMEHSLNNSIAEQMQSSGFILKDLRMQSVPVSQWLLINSKKIE